MAEVLVEYADSVASEDGRRYVARACGRANGRGMWEGWIEFLPLEGGEPLRSGRETTQPNRTDTVYWATGLTPIYLQGALGRALKPPVRVSPRPIAPPVFDGPARETPAAPHGDGVLNPFSVYRKGEALLRRQLNALSAWHLVNIVRAYDLSRSTPAALNQMTEPELVELIIAAMRTQDPMPAAP